MNDIDPNDPINARAVGAADRLVASFGALDTDTALRSARAGSPSIRGDRGRSGRSRWITIAAAAALVIGGTVALAANVATRSPGADAPTLVSTAVPNTTALPGTVADTTTPPTTERPVTTTATEAPPSVAAVSYTAPPPELAVRPLGTIAVPAVGEGTFDVAVGDAGVAVSHSAYGTEDEPMRVDVIDGSGRVRTIPNVDPGGLLAYGPGDVAYFQRQGSGPTDFAVVAVPLSGDNAGRAVDSSRADINLFLEYPPLSFGHGRDGVIHRRAYLQGEPQVLGYAGTDGRPMTLDPAPATFVLESPTDEGSGLGGVITSSTGVSWTLSVDAAPDRTETYVGASPPAAGPDGRGIYVTHIGPNGDPTVDFGEPTMWVIAALDPDGTATWWSIPDDWQVVASDVWGTVLARQTGTDLELALAEF